MPEIALSPPPALSGPPDGPTTMAICNAVVGALKRISGKGPTRVKAYGLDDDLIVIVGRDALTPVERTLVESGHADLVQEARQALASELAADSRAEIEQAIGRPVTSLLTQVDPTADRLFVILGLEPVNG